MENPEEIYDGVRDILKNRRTPNVGEEYIDDLCNAVIVVIHSWNAFFSTLQQKVPTEEEKTKVQAIAEKSVRKHQALVKNLTPKVYLADAHAVDQYLRVRPGIIRLITVHWVERNHQEG